MLSRFHLIPERYGRTDGQTDRFAISILRVGMLTRDKNTRCRKVASNSNPAVDLQNKKTNAMLPGGHHIGPCHRCYLLYIGPT